MGSVGYCYENAMAESFNATLECELLAFHRIKTRSEASRAIFVSLKAGTIRSAGTRRSAISHPTTLSGE
jgi:putative transposase